MNRNREFLVGAVIIFAVAVAVVGTLWLQGSNFGHPTSEAQALTESVGQLSQGNAVTYRGVRIGEVGDITVEPGNVGVRVTLLLEEGVSLPTDAGVVFGPESLFGDWQAEIVSQSSYERFPFYELGERPRGGIPLLGGYALPEITRLTASAEQISLNLANLTDRLELAFNQETADNLASAITNIDAITQEIRTLVQQQAAVATNITASADSALDQVETAAIAARRSFERVDGLLNDASVDSILVNLNAATAGLRELTADLEDDESGLTATLSRADSAFTRVDRIAGRIEAGEGSIGRLLVDTTFAVRAEGALASLDLLLQDIKENPHRYVRLSIF